MTMQAKIKEDGFSHELKNNVIGLQMVCHALAREAGWWEDLETGERIERNRGECYALMHSELTEGFEGMRKNLMDDRPRRS